MIAAKMLNELLQEYESWPVFLSRHGKAGTLTCFPGSLAVHELSEPYFICYVVLPC